MQNCVKTYHTSTQICVANVFKLHCFMKGDQRVGRPRTASMLILKQQLLSGNSAGQVPGYQAVVKPTCMSAM